MSGGPVEWPTSATAHMHRSATEKRSRPQTDLGVQADLPGSPDVVLAVRVKETDAARDHARPVQLLMPSAPNHATSPQRAWAASRGLLCPAAGSCCPPGQLHSATWVVLVLLA